MIRPLSGGLQNRLGIQGPADSLRLAQNFRYGPFDRARLRAIGGRAIFNTIEIPPQSVATADANTMKRMQAINFDGEAGKLCVHRGGAFFEASLAETGSFTEVKALASGPGDLVPAGQFAPFQNRWLYQCGNANGAAWTTTNQAWVRFFGAAWRRSGHRQPVAKFTAIPSTAYLVGDGPDLESQTWEEWAEENNVFSTYLFRYLFRLYDADHDLESQHSLEVLDIPGRENGRFAQGDSMTVRFFEAVVKPADLGTHVRIYRTLLNEPAGVFYRIDGDGDGIAIASVTAGYEFTDDIENDEAILNGTVRADGLEGTLAWAEHGGPPPPGNGCAEYRGQMIVWDVAGEENKVFPSAQGYPESFPVDFDGRYVYAFPFQTSRADRVQFGLTVGEQFLVFCNHGIFRVPVFPTLADPALDRLVEYPVTKEHGAVGARAGCAFSIGRDQAQKALYLSQEHGLMLTDGVRTYKATPGFDLVALIEPGRLSEVEFLDYSKYEEIRIAYTPIGGIRNTMAVLVDYSGLGDRKGWIRLTGPMPIRSNCHAYGTGDDSVSRLYVADHQGFVYVEDTGTTDAQGNYDAEGNFEFIIRTSRAMPAGVARSLHLMRTFVYGSCGAAKAWILKTFFLDGEGEYDTQDKITIGPGETVDSGDVNAFGQGFREELRFVGPTGTNDTPGDAGERPVFSHLEYEMVGGGRTTRSRNE